jgi:phosphoserine phosphatase RsbU/P
MSEATGQSVHIQTLQDENLRLKRAVEELSVLNELARAIGGSANSEEIMQTIIRRSMRAVNAEQGVITLVDREANNPMKTLVRAMVSSSEHEEFHLTQALLGWMHLNKKPLLLNNPRSDDRFRGVAWDESVRSLLCVPMIVKSELKGVITLSNKKEGKFFSDDDQRLLAIIAVQSGQVIENARLNEREKQLLKMQEEVRLAAKIQTELLPKEAPVIAGYDIAGQSIPAQVVGGDYFDFIPMDDSHIAICLGDVTGKGLPASLLMANVQATLRSQSFIHTSAQKCIERSNAFLFQSTSAEKFVTLFYGVLDVQHHTFSFSNAGHDHPFLITPDHQQPVRLKTGGIMLGMMDAFPFEEETILFPAHALLVLYSDGIAEAMNQHQEQFGEHRIAEVIQAHRHLTSAEIVAALMRAAKAHAGTAPQSDDMTIVVLKRLPG